MGATVDNRVVRMQFDNRQFEENVGQSLSTLDKLKRSLNFSGVSKGFNEIDNAANRVKFSGLSNSITNIGEKFNAMQVVAFTALQNITNRAISAGERIISALTIDPVKTGFNEYETKIGSIQTIMSNTASKGTTMKDVTKVIDELNTYADKTIYNFQEMTRNIGTFTAAGVGLETSAAAIQGIANLAAESGSTSQQASTAMYQLSQALSSGVVHLMDWNSVVNAGMGGEKFRTAILQTAKEHGKAVDYIIKDQGKFRDSLRDGWFTAEILTDTLKKYTVEGAKEYADAMVKAGKYTQEQADELIKSAQNAEDAATKVKTLTQLWDTLKEAAQSGWGQTWELIVGDFEEAKKLFTTISDRIGGILGASADARNKVVKQWRTLGRDAIIHGFGNMFNSLLDALAPVKQAIHDIFPTDDLGYKLSALSLKFSMFTKKLKVTKEISDKIYRSFHGLFSVLKLGVTIVQKIGSVFMSFVKSIAPAGSSILDMSANFGDFLTYVSEGLMKSESLGNVFSFLSSIASKAANGLAGLAEIVKGLVGNLKDTGIDIVKKFNEGLTSIGDSASTLGGKIANAFSAVWTFFKNMSGGVITSVTSALGKFATAVSNLDFEKAFGMLKSGVFVGIGGSIAKFIKALTDPVEGVGDIFEGFKKNLNGLLDCFKAYQSQIQAGTLIKIAQAIAILVGSMFVLSTIDNDKVAAGVVAITGLFGNLMGAMTIMSKMQGSFKGVAKMITSMTGISISLLILSAALKNVSSIGWEDTFKGLMSLALLGKIMKKLSKSLTAGQGPMLRSAVSMAIIGGAMNILVLALKQFKDIEWETMVKGLLGIGVLLTALSLFLNNTKFSKGSFTSSLGIVAIAGAMVILAKAVDTFGGMNWEDIGKGLTAVGALLLELSAFSALTSNSKHVVSTGISMMLLAGAMAVLSKVMQTFGNMEWGQIGKGLLTIGVALAEFAIALNAMRSAIGGAIALTLATAALGLFIPVLMILGHMDTGVIAKGLLAIAAAFGVLGVAGALLGPLAPAIVALSGSLALLSLSFVGFGVAVTAIGAGITAIAAGIASLGVSLATSGTTIVAAITGIISGIVGLIPMIIVNIGKGIVGLCEIIGNSASAIAEAIGKVIGAIVDIIGTNVPKILRVIGIVLQNVFITLSMAVPTLLTFVINTIMQLLTAIRNNIYQFTTLAIDIVTEFINGIASRLDSVIQAGFNLLLSFINGVTNAINENAEPLGEAVVGLFFAAVTAAWKFLAGCVEGFLEKGKELMNSGFIKGIKDKVSDAISAIKELVGKVIDHIHTRVEEFKSAAKDLISGFINGIHEKITDAVDAIKGFGSHVIDGLKNILGINSPSKVARSLAVFFGEGFVNGLRDSGDQVADAAARMGDRATDGVNKAIKKVQKLFDDPDSFKPVIRPVVDLSDVEDSASKINGLFNNNNQAISIKRNIRKAKESKIQNETENKLNGNVYNNFTQNNYSPKALSRIDIYRQTKNQLSTSKGLVNKV